MTTTTATAPKESSAYVAWAPLLWIVVLHVGALLAFLPYCFSWSGVWICLFLHWLTGGIGICMTYHRLLTHRSFETRPKALEYVMTAFGCMASEGGPIGWVADHRRHHKFSDQEGDVHSPDQGFGWAHMFWWMTPDITSRHTDEYLKKWAPDLYKDPVHRFLNVMHFPLILGLFGLLYGLGYYFGGTQLAVSWLVWGGFLRTIFVLHTTWLVNSASHIWGYRSHETRDHSTNLWWVAALTYGEGWHNNHHAYATSARHGFKWWEIDPTYYGIKVMQALGLAVKVKFPKLNATMTPTIKANGQVASIPVDSLDDGSSLDPSEANEPEADLLGAQAGR